MGPLQWDDLTLKMGGRSLVAPCFQVEIFTWHHDGFAEFYERARSALGPLLTHYRTGNMDAYRGLTPRAETIVPTWLRRMQPGTTYAAYFAGSQKGVTPAWLELSFFQTPPLVQSEEEAARWRAIWRERQAQGWVVWPPIVMWARVGFPLDHELARPDRARAWILDLKMVKDHPFLSGSAGYALSVDHTVVGSGSELVDKKVASAVRRYPGLDWYYAGGENRILRYEPERSDFLPVVKRVHWITLASDPILKQLGGRPVVRRALGEDLPIIVHELAHGVAIQAGERPELGDLAAREFLPAYRRVAKVLRPARLESFPGFGSQMDDESVSEWLNAFDKEYDAP